MRKEYKIMAAILSPILLVMLLWPNTSEAADIKRVQFRDNPDCYIDMSGEVKEDDAQKIVDLMEADDCEGETSVLMITSGGGSANGGRYVADVIQHYGLDTMVSATEGLAVSAGFSILMSGAEVFIYEGARIGHHSPWIPAFDYNAFYVGKKPLDPYKHNLMGQQMISQAIEQDMETIPAWLIVKYITKIEGEVYWLTPVDLLKLHKQGYIKLLKADK